MDLANRELHRVSGKLIYLTGSHLKNDFFISSTSTLNLLKGALTAVIYEITLE
jgi:hypothetical protein